ncbi:c-type cytochrome [Halobacillus litoralis]|uniref:C-type cytochrome n=1 Tax=Halobacillus litoralis TaxID=45668 RepID=A0A845DQM4_9BACI|nr:MULTISPECIES: cytochrome c [Halobacillus]MCA1021409.1 cytochrome c [Halobacillus litoralis]MYL19800.1 c-type cytochrome [Halobacillus litoralis]MYL28946.1 c-type cytochrome [Halobacillus halophilus]MYL37197.1 c-type cytochrome [Halobacillus litoralis]
MRKNPVIPFAIIAVLGIVAMIIVSSAGINQREAIESEEEGGGEQTEETASADPEEMYQNKCSSCHGGDLSGGAGPNLQEVGSRYSAEEIQDIIINGKGSQMPPGLYTGEQAAQLAEWLAEKK